MSGVATTHKCTDACPAMHEVWPRVYVGSVEATRDLAPLRAAGIRGILSMGVPPITEPPKAHVKTLMIDLLDMQDVNVLDDLTRAVAFVRGVLSSGAAAAAKATAKGKAKAPTGAASSSKSARPRKPPAVLIHCQYGQSRSVSVAIAYVMRAAKSSFEAAAAHLFARRPCAALNAGFVWQLQLYEALLARRAQGRDESAHEFALYRAFDEAACRSRLHTPVAGFGPATPATAPSATRDAFLGRLVIVDEADAASGASSGGAGDADSAGSGGAGSAGGGTPSAAAAVEMVSHAAAAKALAGGGAPDTATPAGGGGAAGAGTPADPRTVFSCARCKHTLFMDIHLVPHARAFAAHLLRIVPRELPPFVVSPGATAGDGAGGTSGAGGDHKAVDTIAAGGAGDAGGGGDGSGDLVPAGSVMGGGAMCRALFTAVVTGSTSASDASPTGAGAAGGAGAVAPGLAALRRCGCYALEPMPWMCDTPGVPYEVSGRLVCPNDSCGAKVGRWDWRGDTCGCGGVVTPAFLVDADAVRRRAWTAPSEAADLSLLHPGADPAGSAPDGGSAGAAAGGGDGAEGGAGEGDGT